MILIPNGLKAQVGWLEGRMQAMESRIERHEDDTASKLDKMDSKLDAIQETLAKAAGEKSGASYVGHVVVAAITGFLSWIHLDFSQIFRSGGS